MRGARAATTSGSVRAVGTDRGAEGLRGGMAIRAGISKRLAAIWAAAWAAMGIAQAAVNPWADAVMSYDSGTTPHPGGYTSSAAALGEPTRFAGVTSPFGASVVSPFAPAFWTDELVSIGEGGHLLVRFDEPLTNDPSHAFGIDFIIFGNGGFEETDFPNGQTSVEPRTFGMDPVMRIAISEDGANWFEYPDAFVEGFFPAQGYLDGGPFDTTPGTLPSDFQWPVNPALTLADFSDVSLAEIRALYDGSGGGTGIDISASGFDEVHFVRISVLDDGNADLDQNVEIDAFSTVPEPSTLAAFGFLSIGVLSRRR
jgi:hypothetical protein